MFNISKKNIDPATYVVVGLSASIIAVGSLSIGMTHNTVSNTASTPTSTTTITTTPEYPVSAKNFIFNEDMDIDTDIQPGAVIVVRDQVFPPRYANRCTLTFAFHDSNGETYAITAGHCGTVGDRVYSWTAYSDPAKQSLVGEVTALAEKNSEGISQDWALIRVDNVDLLSQQEPTSQGVSPRKVSLTKQAEIGDALCKEGSITGFTCGMTTNKDIVLESTSPTGVSYTSRVTSIVGACSRVGDSGGPVYGSDGIYGLLSSGSSVNDEKEKSCDEEQSNYISTIDIMGEIVSRGLVDIGTLPQLAQKD